MKVKKITEAGIVFDNGIRINDHHDQDCCEHVYADWKQIDDDFKDKELDEIKIEGVKNSGFRLNGYFVPCYNEQNGYYGDDLRLEITYPDNRAKKVIDITEFVEDRLE